MRQREIKITIESPKPRQIVQRVGYAPSRAHFHEPGGPVMGFGFVPIRLEVTSGSEIKFEYRTVILNDGFGKPVDWTPLSVKSRESLYIGEAKIPAGGWYRLEIRCMVDGMPAQVAAVEPIGVGEVFLIAGQSYAAGCSQELLRIEDSQQRVAVYDWANEYWIEAHDPEPNVGDSGTIWPPMCNALLPFVQVPIGLINVAVGATASRQWLPGEQLFANLLKAGRDARMFRAVLWQQGESDVIEKTSVETYIANLVAIRSTLMNECGQDVPWMLAKSTLDPTGCVDPEQEKCIREAISRLWMMPGFAPGPDTDILGDENRADRDHGSHLTEIGQVRAGLMWFAAIWNMLANFEMGK